MAREVFLLGCDETASENQTTTSIEMWNKKLKMLGVGALKGVRPVIFRPANSPLSEVADATLPECDSDRQDLDLLEFWEAPFVNAAQAAAAILGGRAYAMHSRAIERSRHEQHIIIVQSKISKEFLRLNPSGMFAEVSYQERTEPMFTTVLRDVSSEPIVHR